MHPSVAKAWPAFCTQWEGRCSWMYLDTKRLVTTGLGNLIDSGGDQPPESAYLPWVGPTGTPASRNAIATEWRRVKSRTDLAPLGGFAFKESARLRITDFVIDGLLMSKTQEFWTRLAQTLIDLDTFPADAQLALLDLAWQNGPAFLDAKKDGKYVWPNMRAATLTQDWTRAASAVPGTGARAEARRRLFGNAAKVATLGLATDVLWDTKTPVAPPVEEPLMSKVEFRGGLTCGCVAKSLPWVELDMLRQGLIHESIDIYQLGYRTDVGPSKGTHAKGGCVDVGQYTKDQIEVWRRWGWTMQRRDLTGVPTHAHGWPYGCPHLAGAAVAQNNDWNNGDAGLVGSARVVGRWPVKRWDVALRENQGAIVNQIEELFKQYGLTADVVPNDKQQFTGNAANKAVGGQTALGVLGERSKAQQTELDEINAKLDRIIAALTPTPQTDPPA